MTSSTAVEVICKCCGIRPASGLVKRHGQHVFLSSLCRKCWLIGSEKADAAPRPFTNYVRTEGLTNERHR